MKINYKESQIDFLAHVSGAEQEAVYPRYMAAQVSLSLENLVILTIVAIMLVIFSFSMGIERGKKMAMAAPVTTGNQAFAGATAAPVEAKDKADVQKVKGTPAPVQTLVKTKALVEVAQDRAVAVKVSVPGAYTLQVASYKAQKFAQREADKLKQKGFNDVYVLAKGAYTIVCVGNFQKKEDASDVRRQLKSRYQDFVVRRL